MTSSPPSDAQYFRGKTLTPVSPVPLHVPEPSHIPVLQNQIDPIFNLMSTHMDPPSILHSNMKSADHPTHQISRQAAQANAVATSSNGEVTNQGQALNGHQPDQGDKDYVLAFDNEDLADEMAETQSPDTFPNHSSTSAAQPSASIPVHENLSSYPQDDSLSPALSQTEKSLPEPSQASPEAPQPTQDVSLIQDQGNKSESPANSDDPAQDGGVNYQALLDNLSPPTSTAPSADNITSITTAAPSTASNVHRPSSTQSPIAALPLPPGLPPRPPPQEKPAIHPNYTTEEDIRSYHYPHIPNTSTTTSSVSQSNNPVRSSQGFNHPLPPNAAVGSNGLPPPPLATFQQPSSQAAQPPLPSPIAPQSRQPDALTGLADRSAVTLENNPDEAPWPLELEKLYDEFISEEARYVAEGVWDRFPSGSRLFVGTFDLRQRDLSHGFISTLLTFIQAICIVKRLTKRTCSLYSTDMGGLHRYQLRTPMVLSSFSMLSALIAPFKESRAPPFADGKSVGILDYRITAY